MNAELLQTPVTYLKGVGPGRADLLRSELGIHTYDDLLHHFPNRYIDKTRYYKIRELSRTESEVQIIGRITDVKTVDQKVGKRLVARFEDETGSIELVWFRAQKWIAKNLILHQEYVIFGRVNWFSNRFSMPHPEMELLEEHQKGFRVAMQPIYPFH